MHTNSASEEGAPIKQDVITSSSDAGRAQKLLSRYLKRKFSARAIERYYFPVARSMLRSFNFFSNRLPLSVGIDKKAKALRSYSIDS